MTKKKAAPPPPPPRKPLWRRLNRYHWLGLHVALFLLGSLFIWSLRTSIPYKQFDTLVWLAVLSAHAMFVYWRRGFAFVLHLLMFSSGNAAIWISEARTTDKLVLNIGWGVIAAVIGLVLYNNWMQRRAAGRTFEAYHDYTYEYEEPPAEDYDAEYMEHIEAVEEEEPPPPPKRRRKTTSKSKTAK